MSRYEFFSPREVIRRYFREFAGSTQNKSHSKSLEYCRKVENLRKYFATFLGVKDTHFISFQFNNYYVNRLIFKYLNVDSNWEIYSDNLELKVEFSGNEIFPLDNLLNLSDKNMKNKKLIWINNLKNINLELFEAVSKLIQKMGQNSCFVVFSLDYLLYSSPKIRNFLRACSFLVFSPSILFQEYGVVFFAFKKNLKLIPIFMGSGAAKFNKETKKIEFRELPHLLEIGTQNFISLILLERFFYYLSTQSESILPRLKNQFLNFNFKENLLSI